MANRTIAYIAMALLAACTSLPEREAATCTKLGFPRDDPQFWDCMRQQGEQDAMQRAAYLHMMDAGVTLLQPQPDISIYTH